MKFKFAYKDTHACEAVVICCIDFRFWKETVKFVEEGLGIKDFDLNSVPGSVKSINEEIDLAFQGVDVPCRLHHVKKIVLVNHFDCGAYGGSKQFAGGESEEEVFHRQEILSAKNRLAEMFPDQEIITVLAKLDRNHSEIEFVKI